MERGVDFKLLFRTLEYGNIQLPDTTTYVTEYIPVIEKEDFIIIKSEIFKDEFRSYKISDIGDGIYEIESNNTFGKSFIHPCMHISRITGYKYMLMSVYIKGLGEKRFYMAISPLVRMVYGSNYAVVVSSQSDDNNFHLIKKCYEKFFK